MKIKLKIISLFKLLLFTLFLIAIIVSVSFVSESNAIETKAASPLDVYFFPLGYNADACIIDVGETEILIDFGCKHNKTSNKQENCPITNTMKTVCDGMWDYIIVTHGDSDHIQGAPHVFDFMIKQNIEIDTIIEFNHQNLWTTATYQEYRKSINKISDLNSKTTVYFADEWQTLFGQKKSADDVVLTILNSDFYKEIPSQNSKNQVSVCALIEYGKTKLLFTGDLQETNRNGSNLAKQGETMLLENNPVLRNGVTFYKAAHHGSSTSSSKIFIDTIAPDYVYIPVVADCDESNGLALSTLENIFSAKENASVYIPEYKDKQKQTLCGNVIFSFDKLGKANIICDKNNVLNKNNYLSFWNNLNCKELTVNTLNVNIPNAKDHCTLIKYGDIDILIDCGVDSEFPYQISNMDFVDKIKDFCTDGILEYVIVTNSQTESISQLIGNYSKQQPVNDGVFANFEIENLIDFDKTNIASPVKNSWLYNYYQQKEDLLKNGTVMEIKSNIVLAEGFEMNIFKDKIVSNNENDYSVCVLLDFFGKKLLFTGDLTNENDGETRLIDTYKSFFNQDICYFRAGCDAYYTANNTAFLEEVSPEYIVISGPLNSKIHGLKYGTEEECKRLLSYTDNIYATSIMVNNQEIELYGDICFTINQTTLEVSIEGSSMHPTSVKDIYGKGE